MLLHLIHLLLGHQLFFSRKILLVVGKVNADDTMSEAVSMYYSHLHTFLCLEEMPSNTGNHFYIRTFINCRFASNVLKRLCDLHAAVGKSYDTNCIHVRFTSPNVLLIQFHLTLELMERLKLCCTRKPQQCLQRECSRFSSSFSKKTGELCALIEEQLTVL